MTGPGGALRPTQTTLQGWALSHDDPDVADDAAVQLAHRDRLSNSLPAFIRRWVPEGTVTPVLFDRFADAWDRCQQDKALDRVKASVKLPDDLTEPPSGA